MKGTGMRIWRDTNQNQRLLLYFPNTTLGWRVIRTIERREGQRGVERGAFRELIDDNTGNLIGFQLISSSEQRGDLDFPSLPSSAAISTREMRVNAGLCGRSRTAGLTEEQRLELAAARDPETGEYRTPEDEIERIQRKVEFYPFVGATQGDILRVWPRA
jgi:hypothetical protein